MKRFSIIAEYLNGKVKLMHTEAKDYIIATEENVYLLKDIGNRLLEDNLIKSYQIIELIGDPVLRLHDYVAVPK